LKLPRFLALVLCCLLLVTACSSKDKDPKPQEPEETPQEEVPVGVVGEDPGTGEPGQEDVPAFRHLFTGLPAEEDNRSRPWAVVVENQLQARPQTGLTEADVVYEVLAEGDITRFLAIYQSRVPDVIGPVRSIRPYFIELGLAVDGVIVHAGWSPEAQNILQNGQIAYINEVKGGDHVYFWRSKDRSAPHNVYTSAELMAKGAEDKKYRTNWNETSLSFLEELPAAGTLPGESAREAEIRYYRSYAVQYRYDGEKGAYLRFMDGEPHRDKESGEQITVSNVLVAVTDHRVLDSVGRRAVNVRGPGRGWLLQGGKIREIEWQMKDGFIRAFVNGEEQKLLPGQTWIQIVPDFAQISYE